MKPDSLYIDPERRFAIGLFQDAQQRHVMCDDWEGISRDMTLRMVTSLEELDEKIAVLDDGLNDVAVERMKFFLAFVLQPELKNKLRLLRYAGKSKLPQYVDDALLGHIRFSLPADDDGSLMIISLPMPLYYEHVMACQLDVRFQLHEGVASNVSSEWMRLGMLSDPGLAMSYFREYDVENSDFSITAVTVRRTATTPTLRLFGLYEFKSQITYSSPVFSSVTPLDENSFLCMSNGSPVVMNRFGGMFDVFMRHLPPAPKVDMNRYLSDLKKWVFDGARWYTRDTSVPIPREHPYKKGHMFRAGTFIDATTLLDKPAGGVATRYNILSAHSIPMSQIRGLSEHTPETALWDLNIFHYNDMFRVIDLFEADGVTLVTLLHVPLAARYLLPVDEKWDFLDNAFMQETGAHESIARYSRALFIKSLREGGVNPLSLNPQWVERTKSLVGLDPNGSFFDSDPLTTTAEGIVEFEQAVFSSYKRKPEPEPDFTLEARRPADDLSFIDLID